MKKKLIKNLLLVLTMVVLCFAVCVTVSAEDRVVVDSGECGAQGDNVIWTLYDDGELVISGEGEMEDYTSSLDVPWCCYSEEIFFVKIECGVTTVGAYAFFGFPIKQVEIAESVTNIGDIAFAHCDNLINIDIPNSVTTIGACAFVNSNNIETINLGSGVAIIGYYAFAVCANLSRINVDEDNKNFSSDEYGVLFNKDKTVLVKFPMGSEIKKYTIPEGVTTVNECAFLFCSGLTDIAFPESLSTIESYGFFACYSLNKCVFNNGIKTVGENAFAECCSLIDIVISDGSESLGETCFANAPFLEKVIVKSMDVALNLWALCANGFKVVDISREEFASLYAKSMFGDNEAEEKLNKHMIYADGPIFIGTIYCHSGSTAEAYAVENGIDYELTHFYEGEWQYDYDNCVKYRKCIHCDELETEEFIPETPVEPDVPTDEDAKEPLYVQLFDLIKMFFALIISLFKK